MRHCHKINMWKTVSMCKYIYTTCSLHINLMTQHANFPPVLKKAFLNLKRINPLLEFQSHNSRKFDAIFIFCFFLGFWQISFLYFIKLIIRIVHFLDDFN